MRGARNVDSGPKARAGQSGVVNIYVNIHLGHTWTSTTYRVSNLNEVGPLDGVYWNCTAGFNVQAHVPIGVAQAAEHPPRIQLEVIRSITG